MKFQNFDLAQNIKKSLLKKIALKNEDTRIHYEIKFLGCFFFFFFILADLYENYQFCKSLGGNFLHQRSGSHLLVSFSSSLGQFSSTASTERLVDANTTTILPRGVSDREAE